MQWLMLAFGLLLGLFAFLINCLALATVARFRSLWVPSNIYMTSLAVSDLTAGLVLAILCALLLTMDDFASLTSCVVLKHLLILVSLATSLTSMLVSVDRFICIAWPYFYERVVTSRRTVLCMLAAWALAATGTGAILFVLLRSHSFGGLSCDSWSTESLILYVLPFFVSILVCGVMYGLVSRVALRHQRAIAMQRVMAWACHLPLRETFLQKLRAVKMFVVVFGVFFAFWMPGLVAMMMYVLGMDVPSGLLRGLFTVGNFNSCLNVFIYLYLSQDFRTAFKRLFNKRN